MGAAVWGTTQPQQPASNSLHALVSVAAWRPLQTSHVVPIEADRGETIFISITKTLLVSAAFSVSFTIVASSTAIAQSSTPVVELALSSSVTPVGALEDVSVSSSDLHLPEAPHVADDAVTASIAAAPSWPTASHTQELVHPGQEAPVLSSGDKVLLGFRSAFSPFAVVGWLSAAGYEQALNGSPNFGTDRGAFGQRLGASALRASTEDVLSESVFAPLLHEDPRYYKLGPSHSVPVRLLYAITRPLINRTDSGRNSVNVALLAGNLAGAELTHTYYPQSNRSQREILETFGGSIGGSAFGYAVYEFFGNFAGKSHQGR
jgi:hypothetical protein